MVRARREWELADAFATARDWLPAAGAGAAMTFDSHASGEIASAELATMLPRGAWAIVSAANPWLVELSAEENQIRTAALEQKFAARGMKFARMRNSAAEGGWEEASCLAEGMSREMVLELCWRFGQAAAVMGIGTRCGLLWTRSERWVVQRARIVRSSLVE